MSQPSRFCFFFNRPRRVQCEGSLRLPLVSCVEWGSSNRPERGSCPEMSFGVATDRRAQASGRDVRVELPTEADAPATPTEAFTEFYREQAPNAKRLAYLLSGTLEASEDIVQDAFIGLLPRFNALENPTAYLRTTIINMSMSYARRMARHRRLMPRLYADQVQSPEHSELIDVLKTLNDRQRAVLVLRFWLRESDDDIARHLGCRTGTVRSLSSRTLKQLRHTLEEQ